MAWTSPRTWTTGEIIKASLFETHIKGNFNALEPTVVTTLGDLFYATGANTLARLPIGLSAQELRLSAGFPSWV